MSLKSWLTRYRARRARRYLMSHLDVTADVLRQLPDVGSQAVIRAMAQLDAAADPKRQTMGFPVLSQLAWGGQQPGQGTLPKPTAFNLRRFSEYPPSRRAINAICNPILDMPWVIEKAPDPFVDEPDAEIDEETKQRIIGITYALQHPNYDESWRVWLEQILEDICVGGYGASEMQATGDPARPVMLWTVDGQSIRINVQWDGDPRAYRYKQSLGYTTVGVSDGDGPRLRDDQLVYFKLNPRTNTPFGLGYLEVAFSVVNAFLGAFDYATRRASNATPSYLIFLGETVDIATARQWQQYWRQTVEGAGAAPIIGGGRQPTVQALSSGGDDVLFLRWQEFLIRMVAIAFGLSPSKLGLERDVNRSTAETQDVADWDTVAPVANMVADYITHKVIHQLLGYTNLRFRWLLRDTDELRQAEIMQRQYDTNSITVNELRQVFGRKPMDSIWGELTKDQYEARARAGEMPEIPGLGGSPHDEEIVPPQDIVELLEEVQKLASRNGQTPAMQDEETEDEEE